MTTEGDRVSVFVDVTVVPMDSEHTLQGQTVIVSHGRIAQIGPVGETKVPDGAMRIDGQGKYLMPGLADMHLHIGGEEEFVLLLANGVTTVRNPWGWPRHLWWREKIARGEILGPTIYTSGPIMDGRPPVSNGSTVVETAEEAERVVAEQKKAGYDFLKVYNELSKEAYDGIVAAGRTYDMPVIGHVPTAVGLEYVLAARQSSIEHLRGYAEMMQVPKSPVRGRLDFRLRLLAASYVDESKIPAVAAATRDSGVWNCVTMVVMQKWSSADLVQELLRGPEMKYVPPSTLARWRDSKDFRLNLSKDDFELNERRYEFHKKMTKALHDAGARILLGTDAPASILVAGFSIHEELHNLVEAGLTPYEAIKTGTRDVAEYLNGLDEFGTVAPGRRADLILVQGNPLENVANVARRAGVMVRGRWLPWAELQKMLDKLTASYEAETKRPVNVRVAALPSEGQREFFGRYTITSDDWALGEETVAVEELSDGRRMIVSYAEVGSPVKTRLSIHLEVGSNGNGRMLVLQSERPEGQTNLEMARTDGKVRVSGTMPFHGDIHLEEDMEQDVLLGAPTLATQRAFQINVGHALPTYFLVGQRLKSLGVGQTAELKIKEPGGSPSFVVVDSTLKVERMPDAQEKGPGGIVSARVYAIENERKNAIHRAILTVDEQGRLLALEASDTTHGSTTGRLAYSRVE